MSLTFLKELFQRILIIVLTLGSTCFVLKRFDAISKKWDKDIKTDEIAKILDRNLK